jgi:hypothetical protein
VAAGGDAELREHLVQVPLNRARAEEELGADLGVGPSVPGAEKAARIVLPDILRYDRGKPVGYPNGRAMTDDTFSARFAWMSDGKIPPQGLKPHADLLSEFPYLGPPNVYPV